MISCTRTIIIKIKRLELKEFAKKYSYNTRRKYLFNMFIEELEYIKSQCAKQRVLVFGSYITAKKNPGDIDIFISLIPCKDSVYTIMKEGLQHKHPQEVDIQYHKTQYFIQDAESMVKYFNENALNKKCGVVMKRAVEIVDI